MEYYTVLIIAIGISERLNIEEGNIIRIAKMILY